MQRTTVVRTLYGLAVTAIAVTAFASAAGTGQAEGSRGKLVLMAPASPGGGWDGFARESQQVLRADGIVNNVQVINVPGAGGTIGLSQFAEMDGRSDMLMITGGVMVGAIELAASGASLDDVTPIARVADDYAVLVVPADSPIEGIDDFIATWQADPRGTSIGGGSLGSIDHLMSVLVGQQLGIAPGDVNYIAYSGGGEALSSLLSGTTTVGMSGYNEVRDQIEAGRLRAIALSSPEPLPGVDIPTFVELGVEATMANWRGFVAAPGITETQRAEFVDIVTEMVATDEWAQTLDRNLWTDSFMVGEEFQEFLDAEVARTQDIVEGLGL